MQTLLLVAAVVMLAILLAIHVGMYMEVRKENKRREAIERPTFIRAASYDSLPTGRDIAEAIVRTLHNHPNVASGRFNEELEDLRDIQEGINNAFENLDQAETSPTPSAWQPTILDVADCIQNAEEHFNAKALEAWVHPKTLVHIIKSANEMLMTSDVEEDADEIEVRGVPLKRTTVNDKHELSVTVDNEARKVINYDLREAIAAVNDLNEEEEDE